MEFPDEIECKAGTEATVELKSNPTTGYRWNCRTDGNASVTEEYIPDEVPKGFVGSGGKQAFRIRSDAPAAIIAVFSYGRPWESEPIDRKTVKITFT